MDDQQIAEQVLEAEGVIRELADHMQRAVEVADAAGEAKQSYEVTQNALQKAVQDVNASRTALRDVTKEVKSEFTALKTELANAAASLDGAGTAVTSFANGSAQKIETIEQGVAIIPSQFDLVRDSLKKDIKAVGQQTSNAHSDLSRDLGRLSTRLDGITERLDGITSRMTSLEKSLKESSSAIEKAVKRESDKIHGSFGSRMGNLHTAVSRLTWITALTLAGVAGIIAARLLFR